MTLIEVLVVMLIIGVLVGITIPALSAGRAYARASATLATQRQIVTGFLGYTTTWRDAFPFPNAPASMVPSPAAPGQPQLVSDFFALGGGWPGEIGQHIFGDGWLSDRPQFILTDARFVPPITGAPFEYPCVFLAEPDFWDPSTRLGGLAGEGQLKATHVAKVASPSLKALSVTGSSQYLLAKGIAVKVGLGFVDGSAAYFNAPDIFAGIPSGEGSVRQAFHSTDDGVALHTLRGVAGHDVKHR